MTRASVSDEFADHAAHVWGDEGAAWVRRIPDLVDDLCAEWDMRVTDADFALSFNFVVPVVHNGDEAGVLKLGLPYELRREIEALRIFDGRGACRVLASDPLRGAMLLERIEPGVPLVSIGECPEAVSAAVQVMKRLRRAPPAGHALPRLVDWWQAATDGLEAKRGGPSPLPYDIVVEAASIYAEMRTREADEVVLHGDLHHLNILSSNRQGWLAIDPHGVTGPPECEIGAFMLNPHHGAPVSPDARDLLSKRLDQFARELEYDREALRRAALAYGVLSATWSAEHGGNDWRPAIDIARTLRTC